MAPVHEVSSNKDLDNAPSHNENDPTVPHDSHAASYQPLSTELSSFLDNRPQVGDSSKMPRSSRPTNCLLNETVPSSTQEEQQASDLIPEIRIDNKQDAAQYTLSGTELNASQQIHSFQADMHPKRHSEIEGTDPATIQPPNTGCNTNRQYPSECHDTGEKRCNMTQEMRSYFAQGCRKAARWAEKHFGKRYMNPNQRFDLLAHEQSGNDSIAFQSVHPSFLERHPNINHVVFPTPYGMSGNQVGLSQLMNSPICIQYIPVGIQDFPLQPFQNPGCQLMNIQTLHPQGIQQFQINQNMMIETPNVAMSNQQAPNGPGCQLMNIQSLHPQGIQQFEINQNVMRETLAACAVVMSNQQASNQYLYLSTPQPFTKGQGLDFPLNPVTQNKPNKRQCPDSSFQQELEQGPSCVLPAESLPVTNEQGLHFPPETVTQSNRNKRLFFDSGSQQWLKRGPSCVLPAASQPSTSRDFHPVPESSSAMISKKPNIPSDIPSEDVDRQENVCVLVPEIPDLSRYERVNIVVYGPEDWISMFLRPVSEKASWNHDTPCKLSFEKNFVRGPILMCVSVWVTDDIARSLNSIRGFWSFSKTTIVFLINVRKMIDTSLSVIDTSSLEPPVFLIQFNISPDVPIIFVNCEGGKDDEPKAVRNYKPSGLTKRGHQIKARFNLSAFLECTLGCKEDTEDVFVTAIDVSFLKR